MVTKYPHKDRRTKRTVNKELREYNPSRKARRGGIKAMQSFKRNNSH
jgi:hypothetical protein